MLYSSNLSSAVVLVILLSVRFIQAASLSSNERYVPVKVGAILLSNIKIEALSGLSGL